MITSKEFRKHAHEFVDWMADYIENVDQYPVKSLLKPGEVYDKIPETPPDSPESIKKIFHDFQNIIMPGMTHWQSPNFFAFFPANSSYPSVLAEMLTAVLGAQCMNWESSPAAAELEEKVLNWLKKMMGLPQQFYGVIQDTASTATLTALLTARESLSKHNINRSGFDHSDYRIYCSAETHSSIEKAVRIAGFGSNNLIKVKVNSTFGMEPNELEEAIKNDLTHGKVPLAVVATLGTTGSTAIDPLNEIAAISNKYNIWLHVDAAFAGTALILEEYQWMIKEIEQVDSFVFNPHKWMFTNFDCSAYFVKNKESLINTFSILPEYLKSKTWEKVNDYRDWGIQLGRRFRALKLWFVIRNFGVTGLMEKLRFHISLAREFEGFIAESKDFELITPVNFNLVCFRYSPPAIHNEKKLNELNEDLLHSINTSGKLFISHTKLNGKYTLRFVCGQTNVKRENVTDAWKVIRETARSLIKG